MHVRFLHINVKPHRLPELCHLYEQRVVPSLQSFVGCISANLIQSSKRDDECISMTLWRDRESMESYEQSALFNDLRREISPYLAESSEWRLQLSPDLELEYEPVTVEPVVTVHGIVTQAGGSPGQRMMYAPLYVRIVTPSVRETREKEFRKLYQEEILPAVRRAKGCRYAFLMESTEDKGRFFSVTIWDSSESADAYEGSGVFEQMRDRVQWTFSGVYQWKVQLERETGGHVATSDDIVIKGYRGIAGKNFF